MDGYSEDTEILAQRLFNQQWPRDRHFNCTRDEFHNLDTGMPCPECDMYQGLALIEMALNASFAAGWQAAVDAVAGLPRPARTVAPDGRVPASAIKSIEHGHRHADGSYEHTIVEVEVEVAAGQGVYLVCSCFDGTRS